MARSLESGGTERQLVALAKSLDKDRFDVTVCLFYDQGELRKDLKGQKGIRLVSMDKKGRWDMLPFLVRLTLLLKREKPHAIYSMLPVPNIIGLTCARLGSKAKIVWGIRASRRELPKGDPLPGIAYFLETQLSRFCNLVIANSKAGKIDIVKRGFPESKIDVIENGIDTQRFSFRERGRERIRKDWGASSGDTVIGIVANVRPVKDHETFLRAASLLAEQRKHIKFVCIGGGSTDALKVMSEELGLGDQIIWTGPFQEMPVAYSALDILCSTSLAEGFSNVIAEAMSCGRPCIVTDVGDSASIVGKNGFSVPVQNPERLASAMENMILRLESEPDICKKARLRIVDNFDTSVLAARTSKALENLLGASLP